MPTRDRTVPLEAADLEALQRSQGREPNRNARLIVDVSALLTAASLLVGGGMAWQRFLDDGKRLDQHDQEIAQLTQIEHDTQQNLAVLNQNVSDIKDSLAGHLK